MEKWLLMQTFYHRLFTSTRESVDAAAGGAFLSLNLTDATMLIEKMASNQTRMKNVFNLAREEEVCISSRKPIWCL
jgi:hypothetical protein